MALGGHCTSLFNCTTRRWARSVVVAKHGDTEAGAGAEAPARGTLGVQKGGSSDAGALDSTRGASPASTTTIRWQKVTNQSSSSFIALLADALSIIIIDQYFLTPLLLSLFYLLSLFFSLSLFFFSFSITVFCTVSILRRTHVTKFFGGFQFEPTYSLYALMFPH